MKKILYSSLIFSLILNPAFLAKGNSLPSNKIAISNQTTIALQPKAVVSVTLASTSARLVVNKESGNLQTSQDCTTAGSQGGNFIQDAGAINLNQPAWCFKLTRNEAPVFADLQVKPIAASLPQVAVVRLPKTFFASENLEIPSPLFPVTPVAPFASFVLAIILIASLVNLAKSAVRINFSNQNISHSLSLAQLRVLRC